MEISRDEVLHVAKLARLALSEEEVERFRGQLSAILEAVGKVSELDLEGVPPTSHPLDLVNVLAEDEPVPSLSREDGAGERARPGGRLLRGPAGMTVARRASCDLARTGETLTAREACQASRAPSGAPEAPRVPPSPTAFVPQKRIAAAPAMSVAAAKTWGRTWQRGV